jgi:hypothetical protein
MYFDLYQPFPTPAESLDASKKSKSKGKGKALPVAEVPKDCWHGLSAVERGSVVKNIALAGHRECLSSCMCAITRGKKMDAGRCA